MSDSQNTQQAPRKVSSKSSKYFEGMKKGEVNELRVLLKRSLNDKDDKKRREIVKKVIAYMTLGIDVSKLFLEMCQCSFSNDLILKKMIYLYITNYAEQNRDTSFIALNTFLKDCRHTDPKIRGLALRNLCSLRFQGDFDYLLPAITEALRDIDGYVRKTAIIGCIRLYYLKPGLLQNKEIIDTLYKMIRDQDPQVCINAIEALKEILQNEGGISISQKMVIYLLNRLKDFNEWGQTTVLGLVGLYKPKSDQEMMDIMNLLDDRLKSSCVSIVLSIVKIFLSLTQDTQSLFKQALKRVKTPLITLMSSSETQGTFEITYVVLNHIYYIIQKGGQEFFEDDYKQFYVRADEPSYIQFLKLEILSFLANQTNINELIMELGEYVTDVDSSIAKKSIETLGQIALRVEQMASPIIEELANFIEMQKDYITNQTMIVFQNILRKYPDQFQEVQKSIVQSIDFCTDSQAVCSLLWIIGQFTEQIEESPYLCENIANQDLSFQSLDIQHQLLLTGIKIFTKRPGEMQPILAKIFGNIFKDSQIDLDLKDKGAFYYRALQNDSFEFLKFYSQDQSDKVDKFTEDQEDATEQTAFQFNTLSIIYKKISEKYIKPVEFFVMQRNKELTAEEKRMEELQRQEQRQWLEGAEEEKSGQHESNKTQDDRFSAKQSAIVELNSSSEERCSEPGMAKANQMSHPEYDKSTAGNSEFGQRENLVDLDINFGAPKLKELEPSDLEVSPSLDPDKFEQFWEQLEDGANLTRLLNPGRGEISAAQLEELFKTHRVYSIATGEQDNSIRIYFFSKHAELNLFALMELEISLAAQSLSLITKSESLELGAFFSKYIDKFLKSNQIIQ